MNVEPIHKKMAYALVLILVGAWFGYLIAYRTIRTNAVEQECAHYDGKTGEFVWGP